MVGAWKATLGHDVAGKRPKAALHAVADNRIADLLGDGETGAHLRVVIAAVADQQDEAGA